MQYNTIYAQYARIILHRIMFHRIIEQNIRGVHTCRKARSIATVRSARRRAVSFSHACACLKIPGRRARARARARARGQLFSRADVKTYTYESNGEDLKPKWKSTSWVALMLADMLKTAKNVRDDGESRYECAEEDNE